MNEITVFQNEKFGEVRTVELNGEPWFVGKDVAEALGYSNTKDAIAKHVSDEDKLGSQIATSGQNREMTIINESGLYSLIFGSKLDSAKEFKHWVTSEVLPSIRKTGGFTVQTVHTVQQDSPLEKAKFLHEMAKDYSDLPDYKQILDAYAVKEVVGTFALPLPESKQEDFSAGDLGKLLGVSANKVGAVANKLGIKTEEYGHWVMDESPYSSKQVRTFRYYGKAVDKLKEMITAP